MDRSQRIISLISTVELLETYLANLKLELQELQSEEEGKVITKRKVKAEEGKLKPKTDKKALVYTSGETISVGDKIRFYNTPRTSGGTGVVDSITPGNRLRINRIAPSGPQAIREPQTVTLIQKRK